MRPIKKGSADQSTVIRIIDSTDGTPENGVEHNSAGIDLWYRREGATKTSITEAALAALDSAHSDGGIELIADGYYRLDLPDAAVAIGANGVMIGGTLTGMIVIGCYIPLVDYNPYDSVRAGLTALPNAASDGIGGLPISDAGGLDLDTILAVLTNSVAGDVWHVSKAGNDGNGGHSYGDALLTIGQAVTNATTGDTIIIHPGDYDENVNADTANKSLRFVGTIRSKSRIVPTTGAGFVLEDGCELISLTIEALEQSTSGVAIFATGKAGIRIIDTDVYGAYDAISISGATRLMMRNSTFRGKYDGAQFGSLTKGVIADNCIFESLGTYSTGVNGRAVIGGISGVFNNCVIRAVTSLTTGWDFGGVYMNALGYLTLDNCVVEIDTGANHTGRVFGVSTNHADAHILLKNCIVSVISTNGGVTRYDLWNQNGSLAVMNCDYDLAEVSGTITDRAKDTLVDTNEIQGKLPTNKFMGSSDGADDDGTLNTIATDAARLTAVRAAVLTDLINGGRLDLLIDAIKVMTDAQRCVSGTVVVNNPGTDTIFDLTAVIGTLSTNNDEHVNAQITFFDVSGGISTTRKISAYVAANNRVTVDRKLNFTIDDGVDTFIIWNKYSPTAAAGGGATAQEVHEYDVTGIVTEGQAGYEIQKRGANSIYTK